MAESASDETPFNQQEFYRTPVSKRWKKLLDKLEQYVHNGKHKVIRIGNFCYVNKPKFILYNCPKLFLGLKDDGTEVAIKIISKSNYQLLKNEEGIIRLPELDHPHIIRYVGVAEDKNFGYLCLQLCEYTLGRYIQKIHKEKWKDFLLKDLAKQFLESLKVLHCHNPQILHNNLKPQNILIDVTGRVRLADFGISRRLVEQVPTTSCIPARTQETEDSETEDSYTSSREIQVAGMMIGWILSEGKHTFDGKPNTKNKKYILHHVKDVLAKDLIEWMISKEPEDRPKAEECLKHPFFWTKNEKFEYLRVIANRKEVIKRPTKEKADPDLIKSLEKLSVDGSFKDWKKKFSDTVVKQMENHSGWYPENVFGLLRFIRNLHEHYAPYAEVCDVMSTFPSLFGCVYKFAKDCDWNSQPSLKLMLQRKKEEDFSTSDVMLSMSSGESECSSPDSS